MRNLLDKNAHVITLRQSARGAISRRLTPLHTAHLGRRAAVWTVRLVDAAGVPLPEAVQDALRVVVSPEAFDSISGVLRGAGR